MRDREKIQWRPWGAEAFDDARRMSKPIFLSISATWCHWCHVMDQDSLDHPEVIRRLNRDFVPIRVDSDQRPDINSRYNMGGWPTVAILDADGQLIVGETYLQTGQLLDMLSVVQKNPSAKRFEDPPKREPTEPVKTSSPDESIVQSVVEHLLRLFDPEFGGFGGPPKFPQTWALELAFQLHHRTGNPKWLKMAVLTLDNMRESGLYDRIDGGFFRYSIRGDWDNPHYEKLLEVNARMLSLYLDAYRLTGQLLYRSTAQGVIDYLYTTLAAEGVCWFYGSQSADEDYYTQSEEERLGAEPPALDRTFYIDYNAMTASALLTAHSVLGDLKYLDAAMKLIGYLWQHGRRPAQGMFHCQDHNGDPLLAGYLSDQARMITALIDAFEATGIKRYLDQALELLEIMDRDLWDGGEGGYWDLPAGPGREGILKIRIKPFADNAVAAMTLTRLFHLTGQDCYRTRAGSVLSHLSTVYKPYQQHAAPFALALERFLFPPHYTVIVGKKGEARWNDLIRAAHRLKSPWKVVLPLDTEEDTARVKSLGYTTSAEPLAYVCIGTKCFKPVSRPEDLMDLKPQG
ncbi:MAG: thioredoxin domain-containing protein [Nitrospirae bacterium]|nr:thioredoxin domain-containing protein [Nitrospirota bacterium]